MGWYLSENSIYHLWFASGSPVTPLTRDVRRVNTIYLTEVPVNCTGNLLMACATGTRSKVPGSIHGYRVVVTQNSADRSCTGEAKQDTGVNQWVKWLRKYWMGDRSNDQSNTYRSHCRWVHYQEVTRVNYYFWLNHLGSWTCWNNRYLSSKSTRDTDYKI